MIALAFTESGLPHAGPPPRGDTGRPGATAGFARLLAADSAGAAAAPGTGAEKHPPAEDDDRPFASAEADTGEGAWRGGATEDARLALAPHGRPRAPEAVTPPAPDPDADTPDEAVPAAPEGEAALAPIPLPGLAGSVVVAVPDVDDMRMPEAIGSGPMAQDAPDTPAPAAALEVGPEGATAQPAGLRTAAPDPGGELPVPQAGATGQAAPVPVAGFALPVQSGAVGEAAAASAQGLAAAQGPAMPIDVRQADWTARMADAVQARLLPDGGTMELALNPADLGRIEITLRLDGDRAEVAFRTETPETARLLAEGERRLADELARQGLTLTQHQAQAQGRGRQSGADAPSAPARSEPEAGSVTAAPGPLPGLVNLIA